jgi:hypothetical protein
MKLIPLVLIAFSPLFHNAILSAEEISLPPLNLTGLYGLSLAADFNNFQNQDILGFYPPESTTLPAGSTFIGSSLRFRYHINNWVYAGLGIDWLAKAFELSVSSEITQTYNWNAWNPYASLGVSYFRGANSFLYLEAGAGRILLQDSTFFETGGENTRASFTGAANSVAVGTGGTWFLIPLLAAEIYGGFRWARLDASSMTAGFSEGSPLNNVKGEKPFLDFSGPVVRLGLSLYLGMPDPFADLTASEAASPASLTSTAAPSALTGTASSQ